MKGQVMPGKPDITRRDFLGGVALSLATDTSISPGEALAQGTQKGKLNPAAKPGLLPAYPPALTGMRGSHPGSFEVAHAAAWQGKHWPRPAIQTEADYDLVVVGGGISGLSAAWFYRQAKGPDTRILILENHDDFGGHAKRNEFNVGGRTLIGYGGSQSIDTPSHYSLVSKNLLKALSIDTRRFYKDYDQQFYRRQGLDNGIYFDQKTYGVDRVVGNPLRMWGQEGPKDVAAAVAAFPIPPAAQQSLLGLLTNDTDYLAGRSHDEKVDYMRRISYETFLSEHAKAPKDVILLLRNTPLGLWGVGWDALSALEAYRLEMPGTGGLGMDAAPIPDPYEGDAPYIFHFPDGNASIARLLVRSLIPEAAAGNTMEDIVIARLNYAALDRPGAPVRIRRLSTAVDVHHTKNGKAVDVTYVNSGTAYRVRAPHVIMAGYNVMLPYICPEMPEVQKEAIRYPQKVPLVYLNVALNNWRSFVRAGYDRFYAPSSFYASMALDFPVSIGDYHFSHDPDEPIILHGHYIPTEPDQGLIAKEQHMAGRRKIYELTFDDFETAVYDQMSGMLGSTGFDPARDIAGITVNRWPHGYAYEYNELSDPWDWNPEKGPHIAARARMGRISIANSDSQAYAYVNGAIDAAFRAVDEQLNL